MCEFPYGLRSISRLMQADSHVKHFSQPITWITQRKWPARTQILQPNQWVATEGRTDLCRNTLLIIISRLSFYFNSFQPTAPKTPTHYPPLQPRVRFRVCGKQEYNKYIVASRGSDFHVHILQPSQFHRGIFIWRCSRCIHIPWGPVAGLPCAPLPFAHSIMPTSMLHIWYVLYVYAFMLV